MFIQLSCYEPGLDNSGTRGTKPDPKCPTPLRVNVMIPCLFHIYIVIISLWAQSLCIKQVMKIATQSIAWLPIGIFPQRKQIMSRRFAYPDRIRIRYWFHISTFLFCIRQMCRNHWQVRVTVEFEPLNILFWIAWFKLSSFTAQVFPKYGQ